MTRLVLVLLMLVAGQATAGIIYQNGHPDNVSGAGINVGYGAVDDFTLGASTTITGGGIWVSANTDGYSSLTNNELYWAIYDGPAGTGALLEAFGQFANTVATATGNNPFGVPEYFATFDFLPIVGSMNLSAAQHWLLIYAAGSKFTQPFILWESTGYNAGTDYAATVDNTTSTQVVRDQPFDLAFELYTGVPAPSTLLLMAGLLVGLSRMAGRKR